MMTDEILTMEQIPYEAPYPDETNLVFLQQHEPTIHVEYGAEGDQNRGRFRITMPPIEWNDEQEFILVDFLDNISNIMFSASLRLQELDEHIAWFFGCESLEEAEHSAHIQDFITWFDIVEYMNNFSIHKFFGADRYAKHIEYHIFRVDSHASYHLETFAYREFAMIVHRTLLANFDPEDIPTTPIPWIVNMIQEDVVEKMIESMHEEAKEFGNMW